MAKILHNNLLYTINDLISSAKRHGALHLIAENETYDGTTLVVNGRELVNFGTLGYMGLEQHPDIKEAAIKAIRDFGVQFSASKTYITLKMHQEIEDHLEQIFGKKTVISSTSSSLGHLGVLPTLIEDDDAIILDHQVHSSIQTAVKVVQHRGVKVEMIRHNNLERLEEMIIKLGNKYRKIWYMIDGVYSMYGDFPPIKELVKMLDRHSQLYLYVDDAHGISWAGEHGRGYTLSQVDYHPKMILTATMGKAFGVSGGIFTFPDEKVWEKVKNFGGALTFSVPSGPPILAACLASAKIHLSPQIYEFQKELAEKIQYCNELIRATTLPLIEDNVAPIFFVATGKPEIGYKLVNRIVNDGFFVNLAMFPAVPVKNTGVRFSISRHVTKENIKGLIDSMAYHYPRLLEEENMTLNEIRTSFRMPLLQDETSTTKKGLEKRGLSLESYDSINKIPQEIWDKYFDKSGMFDHNAYQYLEKSFHTGLRQPEFQWEFYYVKVTDATGKIVLMGGYTYSLMKEDMLSPASVSMELEKKREQDPYYLTSKVISTGTLFTEGDPIYIDRSSPEWRNALNLYIDHMAKHAERLNSNIVLLRDFDEDDTELQEVFYNAGFIKTIMPESCVVTDLSWGNEKEFIEHLSPRNKKHFKQDVLKYSDRYEVEIKDQLSPDELRYAYELHKNVKNRNFDLNTFLFPYSIFEEMNNSSQWEFIILKLKPAFDHRAERKPVSVAFCYKSPKVYSFMLVGMDYEYLQEHKVYRQTLYQTVLRGKSLGAEKIHLGITATTEKRKFNATVIKRVSFIQAKDNYTLEAVETISRKS